MTDIWDKKPGTFEFVEHDVPVYYAEAMDAWLEGVKFEYHKAETAVDYLMEVATKTGEKLNILRRLVEDWLPQIGMTIHFREMFYQIVGEPHPEWFEIPEMGFYERQWMEEVRGSAPSAKVEK